eukprot:CAMPEP_0197556646 /NCGR_PEP_ID=MMETSP1320-20131121/15524_1 /TAXON_ID=91990 /ORGANISM="Bolidomonas sp., Strain RCC2347" /LENGTH=66 /DNA_ID=CAMNT_0043117785 /DNA_START=80 /DNA_END=277 /DNA_ORIENTATION=-
MNRRIKQLELLIAVESEDAFDLIDSITELEHMVESEKKAVEETKSRMSITEGKVASDIARAVNESG